MSKSWPFKDPNEVLDYELDWSIRLEADTITTSTWTVPAGITMNSSSHTTTVSVIWLSGGVEGASYEILNRIVTAGGRTMDQTVKLKIRSK
jgi:hypothetical protein